MTLMLRILTISLMLLPIFSVASEPRLSSPRFTTLSTVNGLAQDSVSDMLLDRDGFLYIGSDGGLDRWDGYQLKRIVGDNNELLDAPIYRVYQDSRGFIWISTDISGVFRLNPNDASLEPMVQIPYATDPSFFQFADSFSEDSDGNIYIALDDRVLCFDYSLNTLVPVFELEQALVEQSNGVRWSHTLGDVVLIATTDGLFAKQDGKDAIELDYLPSNDLHYDAKNVKHLFVDSSDRLWIATVRGLFVASVESIVAAAKSIDGKVRDVKTAISNQNIWRIVEESKNNFWVGSDIGLVRLTADKGFSYQHILEPMKGVDVLSRKDIQDIEIDRDGNLWLATNFGGALYWSPKSLKFSNIKNERNQQRPLLTDNTVWGLLEDSENKLWVGTDNGLTKYDPTTQTSELFFKSDIYIPYSNASIDRIFELDANTLILQSQFGLWQFDKRTGQRKIVDTQNVEAHAIVSDFVYGSGMDVDKRIWFVFDAGYYIYDSKNQSVEKIDIGQGDSPGYVYAFLDYAPEYGNRMWLSSYGSLSLVSTNDYQVELVHKLPADSANRGLYPSSVATDQQGILWITYPGKGLYGLDAKTFEQVYFLDANTILSTSLIFGLRIDEEDNLWFSSHSGIHQLEANRNIVHNYRYGLELNVAEFNEGAVERLSSGELVYGSPSGIVFFTPQNVVAASTIETVAFSSVSAADSMAITEVTLANRDLKLPLSNLSQQAIELDHLDNGLNIRFSNLRYSSNDIAKYEYSLIKNNEVLSTSITRDPVVSLPILEAGSYKLVIDSLAHDGFSMQPAELAIEVAYAPWKSPSAQVFYALVGTLLLISVWWFRQRQRRHLANTRQQLRLFGDAFKQTRDWVVIFSREYKPIAVNPAFEQAFALDPSIPLENHFAKLQQLYPELWKLTQSSFSSQKVGSFWRDERQLQLADGRNHDVLIDLSAVSETQNPDDVTHYLMVLSDISDQKQAERKLLKLATYDNLTGLVNRSLLVDRLEHAITNAKQHGTNIAVLFFDLDRFKGINDSLGHDYGDNLLRVVAKRMQGLASESDTVARMGGDEFVIVREEMDSVDSVSSFIQQLIENIEEPISINGETLRISCSVGVSMYPTDAEQTADLLRYADVAMYSAKNDNVNSFKFFTDEMNVRAKQRLSIENLVKKAYQNQLFFNVYQPIVNIETQNTEGMELLMRCAISEQNISPAEFIPILEDMRLIVEVTRISVVEGIKQLSTWYESGFRGYLSVNLSALHFTASFDLKILEKLLFRYNLPKSSVRFEVTESILMSDKDTALKQFNALRDEGYLLALDDFGTGYSSLSYLKMFPLDVLKIDKSFTDDIGKSKSDESLIVTTIGMAKNLEMDCIAEGIETLEQVQFLSGQQCYRLQGYYFSKPVTQDMALSVVNKRWDPV